MAKRKMLYEKVLDLGRCTFVSTENYTEDQWLKLRQTGIGGSDAGAIMGMNKYSSPLSVYFSKTTPIEEKLKTTNQAIQWGKMAESAIRDGLAKDLGVRIESVPGMFTSNENSFCNANLDGLIDATKEGVEINGQKITGLVGLEIKTATNRNTEFTDDEVPDSYYCQVQHYMYVTGLTCFVICALIDKASGKLYVVPFNPEFINRLIDKETDFWTNHVETGVLPEPTGNERESEYINNMLEGAPKDVTLPDEYIDMAKQYSELDENIKALKQQQEVLKENLKLAIMNSEGEKNEGKITALVGDYKITISKQISRRVSTEELKKAGLYEMYSKPSESIVMRFGTVKKSNKE